MKLNIEAVQQHISAHKDEYLEVFKRLVSQPSISAHNKGVRDCAQLMVEIMKELNVRGRVLETAGQPVVYGELTSNKPEAVTVLFYGHYDVQPPEPLDAWISPPFEPTIRDGRLYGRGTVDNKGQLLAHLCAVKSFIATAGCLPVNAKFIFEGEEEIGSPNLASFVAQNKDLLAADIVYACDGPMYDERTPVVKFGHRGVLNMELTVKTGTQDNHSGNMGGVIPNAAWELVHLLSTMLQDGRITIEGFYDDVLPPDEYQLGLIDDLPYDPSERARFFGVEKIELNKTEFFRKLLLEPTLSINGLCSGYTGPGPKTVIPHQATAKLDARLVVDQDAKKVFEKIKAHVEKQNPRASLAYKNSMLPSRTQADLPVCKTIVRALFKAYNKKPVVMPSAGGSLPSYVWTKILNTPTVGVSYGNPDGANHAPNENMSLESFYQGIAASAQVIYELGSSADSN
ncbi:MAG: M20/M25/M40 family metallo-hydrolase [Firmicutes bacterium]|nr:M20/M25/M40 family metallo-hydrolase [Bacillota bacterium]